jgi:hypothetical protein
MHTAFSLMPAQEALQLNDTCNRHVVIPGGSAAQAAVRPAPKRLDPDHSWRGLHRITPGGLSGPHFSSFTEMFWCCPLRLPGLYPEFAMPATADRHWPVGS